MITNIDIDIFKQPSDAMCHQANCHHIMGGGIAARVKTFYPEAYAIDCATPKSDIKKLGTFSVAQSKKDGKHIYNVYSQFDIGFPYRQTNYEAFYTGLTAVKKNMLALGLKTLSIPKNMGCTLGGGDWRICNSIIEVIFEDNQIDVYICNYQPS